MDPDLLRLYHEVELPVSSVLVRMHLDGIAVDQAACAKSLAAARQQLEQLESQLDFGSRNLFSARDAYWYLHDAGGGFPGGHWTRFPSRRRRPEGTGRGTSGIELAAQILKWRKLTRDVRIP